MTTAASRSSLFAALLVAGLLTALPAPKATAGDFGKVLGAIAVGYLAYEMLDDDRDVCAGYRCPPPPPSPHRNYAPPGRRASGSPRAWYDAGYEDGFKDGTQHGYVVGYRDGDRDGYREGTRDGYRWGRDEAYGDGRHRSRPAPYTPGRR